MQQSGSADTHALLRRIGFQHLSRDNVPVQIRGARIKVLVDNS